jgi:hypothetical protein
MRLDTGAPLFIIVDKVTLCLQRAPDPLSSFSLPTNTPFMFTVARHTTTFDPGRSANNIVIAQLTASIRQTSGGQIHGAEPIPSNILVTSAI